jgi:hypothetical protein
VVVPVSVATVMSMNRGYTVQATQRPGCVPTSNHSSLGTGRMNASNPPTLRLRAKRIVCSARVPNVDEHCSSRCVCACFLLHRAPATAKPESAQSCIHELGLDRYVCTARVPPFPSSLPLLFVDPLP